MKAGRSTELTHMFGQIRAMTAIGPRIEYLVKGGPP